MAYPITSSSLAINEPTRDTTGKKRAAPEALSEEFSASPLQGHHHHQHLIPVSPSGSDRPFHPSTNSSSRVHHIARPSFSFLSVSFYALPCSYLNGAFHRIPP